MSKIGYTITQASEAAGVAVRTIEIAVRNKTLRAHRIDDDPVMLKEDITEWIASFPSWS